MTEKEGNKQLQNEQKEHQSSRFFSLDLIRAFACYMVLHYHSGQFYVNTTFLPYVKIKKGPGLFWHGIMNAFCRPCVPLFVMLSGYLLLPIKKDTKTFLKTRLSRTVILFVIWAVFYAFYYYFKGNYDLHTAIVNAFSTFINWGVYLGHTWYMYMIIGLYLFMPIVSPWVKQASFNDFLYFLGLWGVTGLFPYIHVYIKEIWGECYWNSTPMMYYF